MNTKSVSGVTKFNGRNFASWKYQMEMVLMKKGLWTVASEGERKAAEEIQAEIDEKSVSKQQQQQQLSPARQLVQVSDEAKRKASKLNLKAYAEIGLSLEDAVQNQVMGMAKSAKAMWDRLHSLYAKNTSINQMQIKHQMMKFVKSPEDSMTDHIGKLQKLANQLKDLDAKAAEPEVSLIMYLLHSLDDEWEAWVSSMMASADKLTFDEVQSKLLLEDARRQTRIKPIPKEEALVANFKKEPYPTRTWRRDPPPRRQYSQGMARDNRPRRKMECYVCGGPHPAFKCEKRYRPEQATEAQEEETCNVATKINIGLP